MRRALSPKLSRTARKGSKSHEQQGFGLAIAALAVSAAVTALHVAMWIHGGRPNFELLTTAHW